MLKYLTLAAIAGLSPLLGAQAGDAWQNFNTENTPTLAGDEVQFIEQHNGAIWIGTLSGLSRFADGTFTAVDIMRNDEREKAAVQAWSILDDGDGWLVGTDRGVYRLADDLLSDNELGNHMIAPLLRRDDDSIWALGKHRGTEESILYRRKDGEWSQVDAFAELRIKDLMQTDDGSLWIILDGDGAIRVRPGTAPDATEHVQRGMNVTTVFTDSTGRAWLGFWGRGIAVDAEGQWTQYLRTDRSAVLRFVEDADGAIWIATNEALWRTDGTDFDRVISDAGPVNLLYADSQGRVWVSAQRLTGLRYWNGTDWTVSLDTFLPMRCMADTGDALWAGGVLDGVHRLER